jgi:hypothetical protein
MQVSEIFEYNFDGDFNGMIRSLGIKGSDGIEYFKASEYSPESKGLEYTQSVEGDMVTYKVYDQSSNEIKSFLLEYQLKNVATLYNDTAELYWKFFDQSNTSPIGHIKIEIELPQGEVAAEELKVFGHGPLKGTVSIQEDKKIRYEVNSLSSGELVEVRILFPTRLISSSYKIIQENKFAEIMKEELGWAKKADHEVPPNISKLDDEAQTGIEATYFLEGSLHCSETGGYPCDSCSSTLGYDNHFKGFNVLTTQEDCYVKLTYNNGAYIGNQNNCEVTIKGEKWLGVEEESGAGLVEEINSGRFNFKPANKFVERTMNFPDDNYKYEFANEGKEFRLYLSRNIEEAFKAVPWQNIVMEIKNKETNKVFKYEFEKDIFPRAYSWSNGGVANYGQCVWWAAKRWVEEVDSKTLFPFYPLSPEKVNVKKIDKDYQPKEYDILINYDPNTGKPDHYGFVEKVDGDQVYITQFNWIKPGEVYSYVLRTWNRNETNLYYSNNFYDEYYFKYYYRRMSVAVTVSADVNHAPVITSIPVTSATKGQPYSYNVAATDSDGDILTYSLTTKPTGMSINISWTPTSTGDYNVSVKASDGELFDTQSFIVTVEENGTYSLRDIGPAGGYIFYDKGTYSDGWRYLEAAPVSTEWNDKQWCSYYKSGYETWIGGTGTGIGTGQSNTTKIVTWLNSHSETDRAAQLCDALVYGGYSDWFLPSKDQLNQMYVNLRSEGVGGFAGDKYWSSSEYEAEYAWVQFLSGGLQGPSGKNDAICVRAARAF